MSLINVHAPTEEKEESELEAFYQKVEEIYDSCPSDDKNSIGGLERQSGERRNLPMTNW
jgi:hypothetical protein